MKIVSIVKMPKKYFDICEARKCAKGATHIVIIKTKNRDGENVAEEYSFCEKHLAQFQEEVSNGTDR